MLDYQHDKHNKHCLPTMPLSFKILTTNTQYLCVQFRDWLCFGRPKPSGVEGKPRVVSTGGGGANLNLILIHFSLLRGLGFLATKIPLIFAAPSAQAIDKGSKTYKIPLIFAAPSAQAIEKWVISCKPRTFLKILRG